MAVGVIYTELDLDFSKFEKNQQKLLKSATSTSLAVEKNWQNLGAKSDVIFTAMANSAINSYNMIANRAKTSAAEQIRAQAAMVAKINSLNQEMARNPLYETLGIRSVAAINAQKEAVMRSFNTISQHVQKGSQDWINIERAKNAKLRELNKEMVGEHAWSMAAMARAVLRFYAAWFVASNAVRSIASLFMGGVKAIDDMKLSVISIAAQITSMQGTTGNVTENYRKNVQYAQALIPVLERIDAYSFANLSQIQRMNMAMTNQGVILDVNNEKQLEAFTALTNAVALFTQGQDKEKQATQEIRSLMSGQIRAGDMVAMQMDALIKKQGVYKGGLKELVAEGKKHGDTLERMQPYLAGIIAASGDIQQTWTAIGTSIETAWTIIKRTLFKDFYEDLLTGGREAVVWIKANTDEIVGYIRQGFSVISNTLGYIWGIIKGFGPLMADFGKAVGLVAYGWGGVFAVLKPYGEFLGNSVALTWELVKLLGNAAVLTGALITRQFAVADVAWEEAKKSAGRIAELSEKNKKILTEDILDAIAKYDNLAKAKAKAGVGGVSVPGIPKGGPTQEELDAAKKAAEELKRLRQKMLDDEAKMWGVVADEEIRLLGELNKQVNESYAETNKAIEKAKQDEIKYWIDIAEQELAIIAGISRAEVEAAKERALLPQREADEARKMVTFYQDMIGMEDEYRQAKLDWIEKEAAVKFAGMDKEVQKAKWVEEQKQKFAQETFEAHSKEVSTALGDMANMFQSLSGMYDKNSSEYARMQEAAKAMIVLQQAVAVANAVAAIANQGLGDPYTAFARIAAMAAAMGGLLASTGMSFGGGSVSVPSVAYGLNTTVLGGANDEGSRSIQKGWDLLQDTYDMEYTRLTGIYNEMKDLNRNITGLATAVIRRIEVGGTGGIELGFQQPAYAKFLQGAGADLGAWGLGLSAAAGFATLGAMAINPAGWIFLGAYAVDKLFGTNIIGKVSNFLFGSKTTSVTGGGLSIEAQGAIVRGYTDILTEKKGMFGGLFGGSSSSASTAYSEIDATLVNLISGPRGFYTGIKNSLQWFAENLGADTSAAIEYAFADIKIDLRGLTGEQIQEKLSEEFSRIADVATETLFGSMIAKYQEINEGLFETATRLIISKEIILSVLEMTGQSFSGTAMQAIELSEALIDLAEGLDKLSEAASTYYDKFFSDEEKQLRLQGLLTQALETHNLPLMESRAGYRALIEALDLTVDWQREAYVTMLQLAEGADQYYSYLEEAQQEAIDSQIDYIETLKAVSQTIDEWLANLSLSSLAPVQSEAEWTRQYMEAKAKASLAGASREDVSDYLNFASKYLEMQQKYGTSESYQAIYDAVVGDVRGMQEGKNLALDIAQKQLDMLKEIEANTAASAAAEATKSAEAAQAAAQRAANEAAQAAKDAAAGTQTQAMADAAQADAVTSQQLNASVYTITDSGQPYDFSGNYIWAPAGWRWNGYSFVKYASGGYTDRPSVFGERGGEWAVPTYEPQRRNFLKSAPQAFWDNLGLNGGSNGPGGEVTVHSHIYLDGKEIQTCISKGFKTNSDLIESARRAVN